MSHDAQPQASLYIDGAFVEGEGESLPVHYPYTGEVIAHLRAAARDQVTRATAAAAAAQPAWAAARAGERG
uniref:aldehyde dehydrogenase family protein n=1 Tax=Paracoccus pantotrophus TaxID=82367 RepID=UPI0035B395D8